MSACAFACVHVCSARAYLDEENAIDDVEHVEDTAHARGLDLDRRKTGLRLALGEEHVNEGDTIMIIGSRTKNVYIKRLIHHE